ncbi:hypothetical protein CspHIS471_0410720 [Cutaneotrichosporon sp. HIS471]|nr:hypothetical protein CspHIS471_0410720 [Cutaneotrichosporon sp. HIS471]
MGDLAPHHVTVDAYRTIPLLTGPENYRLWKDALEGFARRKNYVRIFSGSETEPFRRRIPAGVLPSTAAYHVIRPQGEHAGDNPPSGNQAIHAAAEHGADLTDDEMTKWEAWQGRENPARASIIETIAPSLRTTLHPAWSASDCLEALRTKFTSSSTDHKRAAKAKVTTMRLRDNSTPHEMRTHLDTFRDELYHSEQVGVIWSDFDRCDVFLASLPTDTTELLQLKWTTVCAAMGHDEDFDTLASVYSQLAEQHRLRWESSEGVAAATPGLYTPARRNAEVSGPTRNNNRPKNTGRHERGNARDNNADPRCDHCACRFHKAEDCLEKSAGLPSAAERRERIQAARKVKGESLPPRGRHPRGTPKAQIAAAVPTVNYDSDGGDFGDGIAASVLHQDFEHGVDAPVTRVATENPPSVTPLSISTLPPVAEVTQLLLRLPPLRLNSRYFLLDSGAAIHLVNDKSALSFPKPIPARHFGQAGMGVITATHMGRLLILLPRGATLTINDVYYAQNARFNLLSACRLCHDGWVVDLVRNKLSLGTDSTPIMERAFTTFVQLPLNGCPRAPPPPSTTRVCAVDYTNLDSPLFQLHRKLGHMSRTAMLRLAKDGLLPISHSKASEDPFRSTQCWACLQTNSKKLPRKQQAPRASSLQGEILHVDLTGPKTTSWEGKHYALVITADFCRIRYVALLQGKTGSEVYDELTKFTLLLETQTTAKVRTIRCDDGPEFVNALLRRFCDQRGIVLQSTAGYTPEHNAVSERAVGIIKGRAAAMIASTTLGPAAWGHAMQYAALLINMASPSGVPGKSAYELLTGRTPHFAKIHQFGELVFAHVPKETRAKADITTGNARLARLIGRDHFCPGWIMRFEDSGRIDRISDVHPATGAPIDLPLLHASTSLTGRGSRTPAAPNIGKTLLHPLDVARDRRLISLASMGRSLLLHDLHPRVSPQMRAPSLVPHNPGHQPHQAQPPSPTLHGPPLPPQQQAPPPAPQLQLPPTPPAAPMVAAQPAPPAATAPPVVPAAPPPTPLPPRRSSRNPAPRAIPSSYADATSSKPVAAVQQQHPSVGPSENVNDADVINDMIAAALDGPTLPNEPESFKEAMSGPDANKWRAAWNDELATLTSRGSWEETTAPLSTKLLTAKPVFRIKMEDGRITRYKARCTIRGCAQRPGAHFNETFQPVSRASSLRILLNLAATYDLEVQAADFDAAYLNAPIDKEDLFLRFPPWLQACQPGLNMPPAQEVSRLLLKYGFTRVQSEWGLYALHRKGALSMLVLLYVDDLLAACKETGEVKALFDFLKQHFSLTTLGPVQHILGVKVTRDKPEHRMVISQAAFIDTLVSGLPGLSPVIAKHAPLPTPLPRSPDQDETDPNIVRPYGTLVGKLLWLAFMTRPDIAFSVSYLARYTHAPTPYHMDLAMRVIAYLANTRDLGLTLGGNPQPLQVYTDSDWCADRDLRRSTSGFAVFLNGTLINWSSHRQRLVAQSTMEAEYVAAADASREILWM